MGKTYHSWGHLWGAALLTLLPYGPLAAADDPPPLAVTKPGRQDFKGGDIYGTVTGLGKDGFTVVGWVNQPVAPKRYRAKLDIHLSADLRAGRFNPGESAGRSYLPKNLRVGDGVLIEFNRLGGANVCTVICIHKRPGGRVPPSPNVEANERYEKAFGYKYHEYANAKQDWEEKGIPLPDKFKPKTSQVPTVIPVPDLPATRPVPRPVKPIPPAKP